MKAMDRVMFADWREVKKPVLVEGFAVEGVYLCMSVVQFTY